MSSAALLFDDQAATRVLFGAGVVTRLGAEARELGGRSVLLVTDPGIVQAGHADRAVAALKAAGLAVTVYDRVRENPTTHDVGQCLAAARTTPVDCMVGLGGGSSLDTAKGCNFLLTNGGRMQDYWGTGKASKPLLPMIAIPTTAGTGSECQSYALIADEHSHQKMACGDPKAAPRVAILDPELTLTQPRFVTACTGIDTVAHAVETAVTTRRNPRSERFSREAFKLAWRSLPTVLAEPGNLQARSDMLLAAAYGGMAIETSMLGAAHSLANPLTAHFGVVHGQAVGMMLPHCMAFNRHEPTAVQGYAQLAAHAGIAPANAAAGASVDRLIQAVRDLLAAAGFPTTLQACGVTPDRVDELAIEAAQQWTAHFNPRPVSAVELTALYRAALAA